MIVFEVDCNSQIGMGHIMRCMNIADNLSENILFVTRSIDAKKILEEKKYNVHLLVGNYNQIVCNQYLYELISKENPINLCIVDSYFVNNTFFHDLNKFTEILYIDDLNKKKWDVDYLLNNNLSALYHDYDRVYKNSKTRLFLGPEYLLLRDDFFQHNPISIKKTIHKIFISSGGSDSNKSILKILNFLLNLDETKYLTYYVLVGRLNQSIIELQEITKNNPSVKIFYDVAQVASIMKNCDMAISASGNTLYELSYLGIPAITYTIAENQELGAEVFVKRNLMQSIGKMDDLFELRLKDAVISFLYNYEKRKMYHENMCNIMRNCKEKKIVTVINNIIQGDVQ